MHNTSEVLFRLCANTEPQRDSIFTKGPADVLDHTTSEIALGSKLSIDATKKMRGEGFKRPWPPLIKMNENVRKKIDALFGGNRESEITCRAEANAKAEDGCRGEGEGGKTLWRKMIL